MTHRLIIPIFAVLFTAAVSFGLNTFAATFAEPSGTPPANNAAAPLDTSANANTKAGPLTVNSGIVTGTAGPTYGLLVQSGKVGIGTLTPAQKLSVTGVIESTSGGFKFPDGTIQTTAASGSTFSNCYIQPVTLSSNYTSCNAGYVVVGMNFAQSAVWWPTANLRCCK